MRRRSFRSPIALALVVLLAAGVTIWGSGPDSVAAQTSSCTNGVAVRDPANNPGLVSDCEVLLAARDALAGPGGSLDWSPDTNIEQWHGIWVDDDLNRVTVASLSRSDLRGTIPGSLEGLSSLEILSLAFNELTGEVPAGLGGLVTLEELHLDNNRLTGELPQSLTGLTELWRLYFYNNPGLCASINDPVQMWLQNIYQVYGSSCAPSDSSEDREVLVKLYNATDGANWSMRENWLSSRPMRDWHGITTDADGRVTGLLLWRNQLRGEIPSDLGSLSNLETLPLSYNELTGGIPSELGNLSNIRYINLTENQLTGEIPISLGRLTNLHTLYLSGNQLTGDVPTELGNLSRLRQLWFSNNQLSGEIPTELGNLSNLTFLVLSENQLTGEIPPSLSSLTSLRGLYMGENQISGSIPPELGRLPNLEFLGLSKNGLSGEIPADLGGLTNLQQLRLSDNRLSGEVPASLVSLSHLVTLELTGNQFTGCIPQRLLDVPFGDLHEYGLPVCFFPTTAIGLGSTSVHVRLDSPIPVTVWFSEPVYGFNLEDIDVLNGYASNLTGSDGDLAYTLDVTPTAIGEVVLEVDSATVLDADDNANSGNHISLGIPYDDDKDGFIGGTEILEAVRDYFNGDLTGEQVLAMVSLYFASPG